MVMVYTESENGHDEVDVPEAEIKEHIGQELKDGKWVTIEKKDGTSEVLTSEADLDDEDKALMQAVEKKKETAGDDWKGAFNTKPVAAPSMPYVAKPRDAPKKFEGLQSVTVTNKGKGG